MCAGMKKILPAALLLLAGLCVAPLQAQYFGQNKVQYRDFDFKVLSTEHFSIYYYPEERQAAVDVGRMAERWYARFSRFFGHQITRRVPVIIYDSHPAFEQTNAIPGELNEATGGVTEALKGRVVLPLAGPLAETDHVLGHELVHVFQYDMTGGTLSSGGVPGALYLPLWFIEGMAEYLSLGPSDAHTAMWMRDALKTKFPTVDQLNDSRYFPYRYGQALLSYIGGTYGDEVVAQLLRVGGQRRDVRFALQDILHMSTDTLSVRWKEATQEAYQPVDDSTRAADSYGPVVISGTGNEAERLNVAPEVSPDGNQVVFLSARGLFSIDMYLADAHTGEVKRRITNTATDAHFQSLEFIASAGSWSPDGSQFAFTGVSAGRPVLDLYDVNQGRVAREVPLKTLGEAFNASWSPDGRYIAFSGQAGGLLDLFMYDLQADSLVRLTDDAYADLEPAWSPDGRTLAFVTDRFTTDLNNLQTGAYQLGLLTPSSGEIRALPTGLSGKHINPRWTPDGSALYFIADHGGKSDVYRVTLADGSTSQVTNLYTGVSGITALSPAMSVAQGTGSMLYSVYGHGGYQVYRIDDQATLAGRPPVTLPVNAAILPPAQHHEEPLLALLHNPDLGLPPVESFDTHAYHPGLQLDYVAQPTLGAAVDRFGTYVGGGSALYFSDMLGNRNLVTGLQVNGTFKDIAALVGYQNLRHRINWGVVAQQLPYRTGGFAAGLGTLPGDTTTYYIEQELIARQTERQLGGFLAYPFSRVQRVELSTTVENISFSEELKTRAYDPLSGNLIADQTQNLPTPAGLTLFEGSAALVYDNAVLGATSPVVGQRYRLEATPFLGSLQFFSGLADYRKYIYIARPFTLAGRILHYGRYGADAEDPRLQPLFLGYDGLVRGYRVGSFNANECVPTTGSSCPVFDRLVGSRIMVGNLELRFPLFGALGLGGGYYGAFPLELAFFGDAGVAWDSQHKAWFLGGDRKPVYSAGAALRANLLGFAVLELDAVHPFDRPGKGLLWQVALIPGF